jgi:hypothetical protein
MPRDVKPIYDLDDIHEFGFRADPPFRNVGELVDFRLMQIASRGLPAPPFSPQLDPSRPVLAEVSPFIPRLADQTARWVARCGLEVQGIVCQGAEIVSRSDRRFWCSSCGNLDGRFRPVDFPPERARGEAVLELRQPKDRSWEPGESVAELVRQNQKHGDPIPPGELSP